jgi:hypothetical protein
MGELLAKIGLDASHERVFDQCVSHQSPAGDLNGMWELKLADMSVVLDCDQMMLSCPMSFTFMTKNSQPTTMSCIGKGWNLKTHMNWFDKTLDPQKVKDRLPPIATRKIKDLREAQESIWIMKTLAKVRLDYDNDYGRVYSMICDVKQHIAKDPSLAEGRYKIFFNQPEFECSHQMIRSLPFDFVNDLRVGVETNLP